MLRYAVFFLAACAAPDPLSGRWQGDDLPFQLQTMDGMTLSFVAHSDMSFKAGKATFTLTLQTQTMIELGTAEIHASYTSDTQTEPNTATLKIDSLSITPVTGDPIDINSDNIAAGGTLICFPLGQVEACTPRERHLDFSVDANTLRIFLNEGALRLTIKFSRS
jgi:hypothetical protein